MKRIAAVILSAGLLFGSVAVTAEASNYKAPHSATVTKKPVKSNF